MSKNFVYFFVFTFVAYFFLCDAKVEKNSKKQIRSHVPGTTEPGDYDGETEDDTADYVEEKTGIFHRCY